MPFYEREEKILGILSINDITSVDEIAEKLFVSKPTVRRDLNKLAKKGLVSRTHGGATIIKKSADEKIPYSLREHEQSNAKFIIAKKAVNFIKDGYTIMIDGSTSALAIVPLLSEFNNLIVITSGAKASMLLGEMGIKNICTGGNMILESLSYVGSDAIDTISSYNADILFFSCRGLSDNGLLSDNSLEENQLKKAMIKQSQKRMLLCDSTKLGKKYLNNLCDLSEIDEIICEKSLPEELVSKCRDLR